MRVLLIGVLCLGLGGCASTGGLSDITPGPPAELTKSQVADIEAAVRRALKDPDSARFGRMVAAREASGGLTVCGWVNAKNSYGGYTGDGPFLGMLFDRTFTVINVATLPDDASAVLNTCAAYGALLT